MDDSELLEPYSPRYFRSVRLLVVEKADTLLFDLLPRTLLFLCDTWISLFMWFNNMQFVVRLVQEPPSESCAEDTGSDVSSAESVASTGSAVAQVQAYSEIPGDCEQTPDCDHCFNSTTSESHTIRCPAGHLICRECLCEHADVQLSKGDPDLLCLHPSECGLAFTLEDLQKLPEEVLWDIFSRSRPSTEAPADTRRRLSAIPETEEEELVAVENALLEEDESEVDGDDGDVALTLEEAISTHQISVRPPRRTHAEAEAEEFKDDEEAGPVKDTFTQKEVPFSLSAMSLCARSPQQTSVTPYRDTKRVASGWDSTSIPFDSVTAPPLRRGAAAKSKPDSYRTLSAQPSDGFARRRAELDKAVANAKNEREKAQSRLRYARKRVEEGKWQPERLKNAEREREEAGQNQKAAEKALRDWNKRRPSS